MMRLLCLSYFFQKFCSLRVLYPAEPETVPLTCQEISDGYGASCSVTWGCTPPQHEAFWRKEVCCTHPRDFGGKCPKCEDESCQYQEEKEISNDKRRSTQTRLGSLKRILNLEKKNFLTDDVDLQMQLIAIDFDALQTPNLDALQKRLEKTQHNTADMVASIKELRHASAALPLTVAGADVDAGANTDADVPSPPPVSAFGDPRVVNLKGEEFDIVKLGTFSFLSLTSKNDNEVRDRPILLAVDATVAPEDLKWGCHHSTFIRNLSLTGEWVTQASDGMVKSIGVRAVTSKEKSLTDSLEYKLNGKWEVASKMNNSGYEFNFITKASVDKVDLMIHNLKFGISLHRDDFQNRPSFYLNLNIAGLNDVESNENVFVGGILGHGDHEWLESDARCDTKDLRFRSLIKVI